MSHEKTKVNGKLLECSSSGETEEHGIEIE